MEEEEEEEENLIAIIKEWCTQSEKGVNSVLFFGRSILIKNQIIDNCRWTNQTDNNGNIYGKRAQALSTGASTTAEVINYGSAKKNSFFPYLQ